MTIRKHESYPTTVQIITLGECFKHINDEGEEHFYIRSSRIDNGHIYCLELSTGILVGFKEDTIVKPIKIEAVIED